MEQQIENDQNSSQERQSLLNRFKDNLSEQNMSAEKTKKKKKKQKKEATVDNDMAYLDDLIQNHVVFRDKDELKWFNERFTGWLNLQPKANMIFGD